MENHDPKHNPNRRSCPLFRNKNQAHRNSVDTLKRIWNREGNPSQNKPLTQRFDYLRKHKGVYHGPLYLRKGIEKIKPYLKLGKVKRSGRTIRVPYPIRDTRAQTIRIKGLFQSIPNTKDKGNRLGQELIEIQRQRGKSKRYAAYLQYISQLKKNKKNIKYRW